MVRRLTLAHKLHSPIIMMLEQTGSGWETRLKINGASRFLGAPFLAFWLAGWAVGEVFALSLLAVGACSLVTGRPPGSGHNPLTLGVALPVGLFLLFWLTFWTFGGFLAGRELLR